MSELRVVKAVDDLPPLPPGSLRLYDNLLPKLKAAAGPAQAYQIAITQVVDFPHYDKPKPPLPERTFSNAQAFVVEGPQFLLNSAQDVFSVSPASNEQGQFGNQFPHIVLTDPHLPWVRPIDPGNVQANPDTPWMALLLLDEGDFANQQLPAVQSHRSRRSSRLRRARTCSVRR